MSKEYISYQIDSLTLPAKTNVSVNLGKAVRLSSIEMGGRWADNNYLDITFKMNGDVVFKYRVSAYTDPFKYEFEVIVECDEVVFRSNSAVQRKLPAPFIFYSKRQQIKTLILSENNAYTLEDGIWVNKGLVPDNPEERDDFYLEYGFEETDATRDKLNELKNILPNGKGKISVRRF